MNLNKHLEIKGLHAPFSPSQPAWINYSDEKIVESYTNKQAAELGTRLHAWAAETITLRIKQPKNNKTLSQYVNDAIGFRMEPEVILKYSDLFFGTADALIFENNILRIHDLKTGVTKVHKEQLEIYAALFCLEYGQLPTKISIVLRLYQNNEITEWEPEGDYIFHIMERIKYLNKLVNSIH